MLKLKTRKATAKRLKRTASGKISRFKSNKNHLLTGKTSKRKRSLRQGTLVKNSKLKVMKKMVPYI